jgi:DNA-binding response OmpR family regulator
LGTLLVEPDPRIREFCVTNLKTYGRPTHEAGTLAAAWHASTTFRLRLIIMEIIGYEDGDGYAFVLRLSETLGTAHIPVLVMTTHTEDAAPISDLPNVQLILIKPITRVSLLTAVDTILGLPSTDWQLNN